jgi:hypothetical protein
MPYLHASLSIQRRPGNLSIPIRFYYRIKELIVYLPELPVQGANSFFHLLAVGVVLPLACLAYLYYYYCLLARLLSID